MNISHKCNVCGNYTDVYIETGYIRTDGDGMFYVIPEDRLAVWDEIQRRYDAAPTLRECLPILDELYDEFDDCRIDSSNVENYKVVIE